MFFCRPIFHVPKRGPKVLNGPPVVLQFRLLRIKKLDAVD
jgi:hypothetical protein